MLHFSSSVGCVLEWDVDWVRVWRQAAALLPISNATPRIPSTHKALISFYRQASESRGAAVTALSLGLLVGFPNNIAYQDMSSMITGADAGGVRWNAVVEKSGAGTVQAANMPYIDRASTGSISGGGLKVPGIGRVALEGRAAKRNPISDEDRVTRTEKKGRIVNIAPVAPPKAFNAGTILDRTSSLLRPSLDSDVRLAFARLKDPDKAIELAGLFQIKRERPQNYGVPEYLVALVNNQNPDILATAYAPAGLMAGSPFDLLLKDDPNEGRFIPPMGKGDHGWLSQALPAAVFSEPEQKCLSEAIYFEARGESLEGQAAVAQVVLNRVRNPTYPKTICGVVYQNKNWFNRCQFSFACDGVRDRITEPRHYKTAQDIAMAVTAGKIFLPEVGSSTHYYAQYVSPGWARAMKRMTKIGLHIFYRTKNGGWS